MAHLKLQLKQVGMTISYLLVGLRTLVAGLVKDVLKFLVPRPSYL